jgi:hypothetical protein
MDSRDIFQTKPPTDTKFIAFDFTGNLSIGETIDTQECSAEVFSGTDANPGAIVSGSASANGAIVRQLFTAGVVGTVYTILCTIETSLGQTLTQAGYLAIVTEAAQ